MQTVSLRVCWPVNSLTVSAPPAAAPPVPVGTAETARNGTAAYLITMYPPAHSRVLLFKGAMRFDR